MTKMNQLLKNYTLVNENDFMFVPSDIENLYTCYSKDGCVHTGIRIRRKTHIQTKSYYFVSKEPMYTLESDENIFDDMPLMSLEELEDCLKEIDYDFNFDE